MNSHSSKGFGFTRKDAIILFFGLVGISLVVFFLGLLVGRELSTYSILSQLRPLENQAPQEKTESPPAPAWVAPEREAIPHLHVGKYTLQVALFPKKEEAEIAAKRIKDSGFPSVYLTPSKLNDRDYFMLDVGRFPTEQEAQKFAQNLLKQGVVTSYLVRALE